MSSPKYVLVWHALDRARVARVHGERVRGMDHEEVPRWASYGEEHAFLVALERVGDVWPLLPPQVKESTRPIEPLMAHARQVRDARALDEQQRLGLAGAAFPGDATSRANSLEPTELNVPAAILTLGALVAQLDLYLEMRLRARQFIQQAFRKGGDVATATAELTRHARERNDDVALAALERISALIAIGGSVHGGQFTQAADELTAELACLQSHDYDVRAFAPVHALLRALA